MAAEQVGKRRDVRSALAGLVVLAMCLAPAPAAAVTYDIVYVRQPRYGDNTNTTWPEVAHPARIDPGADLMLLHPDGSEEVLVAGGVGAVTDPFISFDARWVYYSLFYDVREEAINYQRGLPYDGADIFRINLATREIQQLTFQEFTPNTGAGRFNESNPVDPGWDYDSLGYGILNLGAAPLAGGKIVFTSNRNGFVPPRGLTNPTMQLFVMDEDGGNVTQIAPMNIGSALHPTPLRDGRLMFSTLETQGLRDTRMWGIWAIWPDGRHWEPVVSAFHGGQAFHFMTQLSNDELVVTDYYNLNNNGFGALFRMPVRPPSGTPPFFSAFPEDNPPIAQIVGAGFSYPFTMPFTPYGFTAMTPFTHPQDEAAPIGSNGQRVGKFTHPSAAPNNDLLTVWSPGPCNDLDRPTTRPEYDAGLYLIPNGGPATSPSSLQLIKNSPNYNEAWPRAVVTYRAVHGVDEPARLSWLPNDGALHSELPAGTPYGLVGTSSVYKRESFPGIVRPWSDTFDGLDQFNTAENDQSSNWGTQGADAGKYANSDIWAIRIVGMEPGTHRSYGPNGGPSGGQNFSSHAMERLRIFGEVPLRKFDVMQRPVLDSEGNPDTSFLVKIPADTPFTFQTLDRNGMVLNMAQTWHQVRPGEVRNNCGGCHAHSQQPLDFTGTAAAAPTYQVRDLSKTTPLLSKDAQGNPSLREVNAPLVTVEFLRDIRPILQRSCVPCHTGSSAPGNLRLDVTSLVDGQLPGDYARLADDWQARWGYPPVIGAGAGWRQTNASRYIRMFQSRRSLLMWKLYGQRLDGWTNAEHPTETTPGNAATLPAGANANEADLDFTGQMMPPPGSGVPPLSEDEKMLFARWIDLGAPINWADNGANAYGWFLDDLRPSLNVSLPRPGVNDGPLTAIRLGAADANSGINWASLSITADFAVNGRAAGAQLADLVAATGDGIRTLTLSSPIASRGTSNLLVTIKDVQGNITRVARRFSVQASGPSPTPTATLPPTATRTPTLPPATATVSRTATRTFTATATGTPTVAAQLAGRVRYYRGDRAVAGVALPGTTSGSDGAFTVGSGIGAAVTLRPQRSGGFNGGVSALDAAQVLQAIAGARTFDAVQALACDATGNGSLSTLDATRILELTVGVRSALPVAQACGSDWVFLPEPSPAAGQQVTQPLMGASCTAGAIAFSALPASASGQDFRAALFGDCTGNWQAGGAALARSRGQLTVGPALATRDQLRVPLRVRGGSALEIVLNPDPTRLRFAAARADAGALLRTNLDATGRLRVAAAASGDLDGVRLTLIFDRLDAAASIADLDLDGARVDDAPARISRR
jgi:hypothetical protein